MKKKKLYSEHFMIVKKFVYKSVIVQLLDFIIKVFLKFMIVKSFLFRNNFFLLNFIKFGLSLNKLSKGSSYAALQKEAVGNDLK